ncbi:MAG TPA: glycoside hydrolase family 3 protein [Chloroflexota bacterium]|nr:glycoside hydrolase family 3 protein [Chloroflexota bacterium]
MQRQEIERLAAGALMVGFPGTQIPDELIRRGVRNFILFARNIGSAGEVRTLTTALRAQAGDDALIAIDHEGGRVNRLAASGAATQFPSAMAWAATGDVEIVRTASAATASELRSLGINVNFAPVVDLLANHRNPALGTRCFSDDPDLTARFGAAYVAGHREAGVASTAKHFAGHGATPIDSHVDLPEISKSIELIRAEDLVPFTAAVTAGAEAIMVSHAWYPVLDPEPLPATVSPAVAGLAREIGGDETVIVTDCMEMGAVQNRMTTGEAAVRALAAGVDLVLISHTAELQQEALDAVIRAVESGDLPCERLEEANRRLDTLRYRLSVNGRDSGGGPEAAREIARRAVTLVKDEAGLLPLSSDQPLAVVTFASMAASVVEGPKAIRRPALPGAVAARHRHAHLVAVEPGMDVGDVLAALKGIETVLVGTAFATGRPVQADVVRALLAAGKRVVVVALADPFDLLSFPEVPTYLVSYDDTAPMLDATLDVLFGMRPAQGVLPVDLPGLYPRGTGKRAAAHH